MSSPTPTPPPAQYSEQPSPTPPTIGFTGKPLNPKEGENEYREYTPDKGGYFLWKKEKVRGKEQWMPVDFIEAKKELLA